MANSDLMYYLTGYDKTLFIELLRLIEGPIAKAFPRLYQWEIEGGMYRDHCFKPSAILFITLWKLKHKPSYRYLEQLTGTKFRALQKYVMKMTNVIQIQRE
eukprot:Pgem_evm1s14461